MTRAPAAGTTDAPADPLLGTWVRVPLIGPDGFERLTFAAGQRWSAEGTLGTDAGAAPRSPFHFRTMGGAAVGTQLFERAP